MGFIVLAIATILAFNSEKAKEYDLSNFTLFTYSPFLNYKFKTNKDKEFEIAPTQATIAGIAVKRKSFTYAFGYQTEDESNSNSKKTNFFDIQLASDFGKVLATAYYQNYQGFFENQSGLLNLNDQKSISSVSYGVNLRYFTKKDYDLGSTILSDKKKRVPGYSFFHSAYANSTTLKNDSDLFNKSGFETLSGLKQMNAVNLGYEYGLSGTYHFWWMRVTGLFSLGYNLHHLHMEKDNTANKLNGSVSTSVFFDLGFLDTKRVSMGIFAKMVSMEFAHKDITIEQRRASATLYLRYFF